MSKKCKAYSASKLGLEAPDNRKAFYKGWDAAINATDWLMPDVCDECEGFVLVAAPQPPQQPAEQEDWGYGPHEAHWKNGGTK